MLSSVFVFTHLPAQTVPPQVPFRQHWPLAQTFPQVPQFWLSVCRLVQVGNPFFVQVVGAEPGQVQPWKQILPVTCSVVIRQVAPTGQHICCRPTKGTQPKPQVNSAQVAQVWVFPQTQVPFWQTSNWPQA